MNVCKHEEWIPMLPFQIQTIPGKIHSHKNTHHFVHIMLDAGLPNSTPCRSWACLLLLLVLVQSTVYYGQESKEEHLMSLPRNLPRLDCSYRHFGELPAEALNTSLLDMFSHLNG